MGDQVSEGTFENRVSLLPTSTPARTSASAVPKNIFQVLIRTSRKSALVCPKSEEPASIADSQDCTENQSVYDRFGRIGVMWPGSGVRGIAIDIRAPASRSESRL